MQKSLFLFAATCLLCGCSVTQQLSIEQADGEHEATSYVTSQPFFVNVANDFDTFTDPDDPEISVDRLMEEMAESFRGGSGVDNLELEKVGERSYMLFFTFHDIQGLVEALGGSSGQDILTLKDQTLSLHLSIDNYPELEKIVPILSSDDFQPFGPRFNQGISEEEYLDMLSFMLGDEAPDAVRTSSFTIKIDTPKPITSVSNMQKESTYTASFTFPLIDVLLLQHPIDASVSWN